MSKYTGPWTYGDNYPRTIWSKDGTIVISAANENFALADAYLIAAAPELLEACKLMVDAIDIMRDGPDDSDMAMANDRFLDGWLKARAAITKTKQPGEGTAS